MITLNEHSGMILNGIVLIIVLFYCIQGYRKGLLRSILSLLSTLTSYFLAWVISDSLAEYFPILKLETIASYLPETLLQIEALSVSIVTWMNRIIWFVVMFFILKLLCFIIDTFLKQIQKIPGIHGISSLLGILFGLIESFVWIIVITIVIETPLFTGGQVLIKNSVIAPVKEISMNVFSSFQGPLTITDTISEAEDNISTFTSEQLDQLQKYIQGFGDSNEY